MKKLFIAAAFALASFAAFAQSEGSVPEYLPKHEFTFNVFGGLNLGSLMLPGQQNTTISYTEHWYDAPTPHVWNGEETNGAFHTKPALALGLGFGYIYHFDEHWAFQTGLDLALYKYSAYTKMDGPTDGYTFGGMYYGYDDEGDQINLVRSYAYCGFKEDSFLGSLQIPLMVQWSAPIYNEHRFYVAAGPTIGINVFGRGKQKWTNQYPGLDGCRSYDNSTALDVWILQNDAYSMDMGNGGKTVRLDNALLDIRASLELGVRWALDSGWGLYTGIYADYGFLNNFVKKDYGLIEGRADWKSDGSMQDPYEDSDAWQYRSIFNSTGLPIMFLAETYGSPRYPAFQVAVPGNRYFNGPIQAGSAGLKIRLSFGKVNKPAKPAPVAVPAPVRAAAPAPAPVAEVPEEIKQTMIELSNTLFAFDKFNLDEKAIAGLNKVIAWLQDNPQLHVQIDGHTDNYGPDEYNQILSENRAKSVYEYFVAHGVDAKRLSYKGYGESRPIATNDTAEGRQQNRRVELTIIK